MSNKHYVFTEKDRKKGLKVRCSQNGDEARKKGYNARARRIDLGIPLQEVAEILGITTVSVVNKETNKQQFNVGEAIKLIKPYQIENLDEFIKTFKK